MNERKIDDGGPSYPCGRATCDVTGNDYCPNEGVAVRDYFAARAPDVPNWFRPHIKTVAERVDRPSIIDEQLKNPRVAEAVRQWRKDPCYDLESVGENPEECDFLRRYDEAMSKYADACEQSRHEREAERYFLWRWYYADAMLAERKKGEQ